MKVRPLITAAAMAASLGMGTAQAADGNYANVQLAFANVDGFDNTMSLVAAYGIPVKQYGINVELELTKSLADASTSATYPFIGTVDMDASYLTLAGYAVYTMPLQDKLDLRARAGLLYESVSVSVSNPLVSASADGTDTGLSFGVGLSYAFKKDMNIVADYTIIEQDISHLAVGVQVPF